VKRKHVALIIFAVLLLDQAIKIWVKVSMPLGSQFAVFGDWFIIHFSENPGMAFGLEFGGEWGKLALTIFRIVAVGLIFYFISQLIKNKAPWGFITAMSLILAGALGNILDSTLYGLIFDTGTFYSTELSRWVGYSGISKFNSPGYSTIFKGCVVDMLYFPIIKGYLPDWVPIWGGQYKTFFEPIFNIADSAISIGVFLILIFNKTFLKEPEKKVLDGESEAVEVA